MGGRNGASGFQGMRAVDVWMIYDHDVGECEFSGRRWKL